MTTFAQEHAKRIKSMEDRAKAAGTNMTQVCKTTGIARATYERWGQRPPQSITKLDELDAEVTRVEGVARQEAAYQAAKKKLEEDAAAAATPADPVAPTPAPAPAPEF